MLVPLAEHGLDALVQLLRHVVHCLGDRGHFQGAVDNQTVVEFSAGESLGAGLDLLQRAAHVAGNHQADDRVEKDSDQGRRHNLMAHLAQGARQRRDGH